MIDFLILAVPTFTALAALHWLGKWDANRTQQQIRREVEADATRRAIKQELERSV